MPADPATAPDDPSSRAVVGGRNLPVAIAVGVVLAAVFLGSLAADPWAFTAVVAALTTVAYLEVGRVLAPLGRRVLVAVLVPATWLLLAATKLIDGDGQVLGVTAMVLAAVLWLLADRRRDRAVDTLATTLLLGLWVGLLASFAVRLVMLPDGVVLVLAVIGAAIITDIGGYAFGVSFGRHKVAPRISPNKSWEGLIGGVALAVVLAAVVLPRVGAGLTTGSAAAIALACGSASFLGDLLESLVKRDLGLKDLGDVLPGHGGVLDRVDGILLALPVGYAAILVVG